MTPGGVVAGTTALTIATSAIEPTATGSSSRLLAVFVSPPPPVTPVLMSESGALSSTFTITLTGAWAEPGASASERWQCSEFVAGLTPQSQPAPAALTTASPAGSVSSITTAPSVARPPTLLTSSVNVPCDPRTNVPVCDLSIVTSGTPRTVTAAGALAIEV